MSSYSSTIKKKKEFLWLAMAGGAKVSPCLSFVTLGAAGHPDPGKSRFSCCRRIQVSSWTLSTSQGATNSPTVGGDRSKRSLGDQGQGHPQRTLPDPLPVQHGMGRTIWGRAKGNFLFFFFFDRRMSSQSCPGEESVPFPPSLSPHFVSCLSNLPRAGSSRPRPARMGFGGTSGSDKRWNMMVLPAPTIQQFRVPAMENSPLQTPGGSGCALGGSRGQNPPVPSPDRQYTPRPPFRQRPPASLSG